MDRYPAAFHIVVVDDASVEKAGPETFAAFRMVDPILRYLPRQVHSGCLEEKWRPISSSP
jgi:hypothetical protein